MKLYLTFNSVPELAGLSRDEQRRVWRACYKKTFQHWQTRAGVAVFFVILVAGLYVGPWLAMNNQSPLVTLACGLIGGALGGLIFNQIVFTMARRYFRAELGLSCPHCDYDLRGNPTNVCPECGLRCRQADADPK